MRNGLRVTGYFDGHGFTGVPATDAGTGSGPNEMEVSVYCPWHAVNSQLAVAFAALPQVQTACNAHNATLFLSPSLSIYLSHKHTLLHFLKHFRAFASGATSIFIFNRPSSKDRTILLSCLSYPRVLVAVTARCVFIARLRQTDRRGKRAAFPFSVRLGRVHKPKVQVPELLAG